jgi:putative tryptophan/tyrosine transport system substrate-binding protein
MYLRFSSESGFGIFGGPAYRVVCGGALGSELDAIARRRGAQLRRRDFIALLGGAAAAWPLPVGAQQAIPLVGFLQRSDPIRGDFAAFQAGLKALGYEEGRNIRVEQRYGGGAAIERMAALARELIALGARVFVLDGVLTVETVRKETNSIPIVSAILSDPARLGITNLSRPGGQVTGLSTLIDALFAKRIEAVKEMFPQARRIAVLRNSLNLSPVAVDVTNDAAKTLGLELRYFDVLSRDAWPATFAAIAKDRPDALLQFGDATFASSPREAVSLALTHSLPAIYAEREFVEVGGLMSYGISYADQWRRAGGYVDKILKGAIAGDLPIEQPTKFELVLNLKTAKALGIDVPPMLLARADEVIE